MRRFLLIAMLLLVGCTGGRVEEIQPQKAVQLGSPVEMSDSSWPWWRGPNRNGVAAGEIPPIEWSEENRLWSTAIDGRGHASPIVVGELVLVTTAIEEKPEQKLIALDKDSGEIRWETSLHRGELPAIHHKNSHASASAASDGERIFVTFYSGSAVHTSAVDLQGNVVWQRESGPFNAQHGFGASPAIYRSLVITAGDSRAGAFLTAHERKSGEIVWRTARGSDSSYATPVIGEVAGKTQILLSGIETVSGYDPESGKLLWSCPGPADTTANTMAWHEDIVFATGGYPQKGVMAIRLINRDGQWQTKTLWKDDLKAYVPSPIVYQGRLYAIGDGGIGKCYHPETGEVVWLHRVGGNFTSSPVAAGKYLFAANEGGMLYVLLAGDTYSRVAQNDLGDRIFATPVIVDGRIYLRGHQRLHCIGPALQGDESATDTAVTAEKKSAKSS